ncbi:MAG: hypothetical protein WBJ41_00585 [Chromatiaceae bacterium]
MKKGLSRLVSAILILVALYLIGVNLALNLPATQAYLNSLRPDRLAISWERAWSWYPLRVEFRGFAADGQTPTEQWQVDAERAAAAVSLRPLFKGLVRVHDLDLVDIDLRLRPRSGPIAEDAAIRPHFPVIRNRDPEALAEPVPEEEGGNLLLEIADIHVQGHHAFWVSHVRGTVPGEVRGSFSLDTGAGRFGLRGGALDLVLASLRIGDAQPVTDPASIKGQIEVPPFVIAEAKGLGALILPEFDAEIDLPVQNLDFLTLLTGDLAGLDLKGQGRLRGRLVFSHGELLPGTDLIIEAHKLAMTLARHAFNGDGTIELKIAPDDADQADLVVRFDEVQASLLAEHPDAAPGAGEIPALTLFSGHGLEALLHIEMRAGKPDLNLTLTLPAMEVPDLRVYNRLLPAEWGMRLLGGSGRVNGQVVVAPETMRFELDLASDQAHLSYRDYQATTDLSLQLRARIASAADAADAVLDLSGTKLRLDNAAAQAKVKTKAKTKHVKGPISPKPWQAELEVNDGNLSLPLSAEEAAAGPVRAVAKALADQGFGALLATTHGRLLVTLILSRLDWIAELLHRPLNLSLKGAAEIDAEILLANGLPAPGTTLQLPPEALELGLLEHRVEGLGRGALTLEQDGHRPRLVLNIALTDARMRRQDESEPSIDGVRLDADVVVTDPFADHAGKVDMALKLHSARVRTMSSYNPYLPAHAPLSLISGEASLVGDLQLDPKSLRGELLLLAKDVRVALSQAEMTGDIRLDLLIRGGSAADMRFDITGSTLGLKGFKVTGETASALAPDWHAHLELEKSKVLWRKPMHLDMKAAITIKDTRPFVALLDNARGEHRWIEDLLLVENLGGHIQLIMDGDSAVLKDATIGSGAVGVQAKGHADDDRREAMLLVRWHSFVGALEMEDDWQQFELGDARARFDAYRPGATGLPSRAGARTQPADSAGKAPPGTAGGQAATPHPDKGPQGTRNPFLEYDP